MKTRAGVLIATLALGGLAPIASAAEPATTQPAVAAPAADDAKVRDLIVKLGAADAGTRKEASAKLAELGKAALPALKALEGTDDPELRARVKALIRRAERRLPPAAPATDKRFRSQSMKVSVRDGVKTMDINDNGYQIRIERNDKAAKQVKMSVTGIEDGKEVTEVYEAKDPDELKRDNPEAYALYERWGGGLGGGVGNGAHAHVGVVIGDAAGAGVANIERVREMLKRQIAEGNLPAEHQLLLQEQINRLEQTQREMERRMAEVEKRLPPAPPAPPDADGPPGAPPVPPQPPE